MYVDIVSRDASGKVTQKAGSGYHLLLHQAAAGTKQDRRNRSKAVLILGGIGDVEK